MMQQEGALSVPELVELAGHKAHLERERALSRIEQLVEGAGGAAMQLTHGGSGKKKRSCRRRRRRSRHRSTRRAAWPPSTGPICCGPWAGSRYFSVADRMHANEQPPCK